MSEMVLPTPALLERLGAWLDLSVATLQEATVFASVGGYLSTKVPLSGRQLSIPRGTLYTVQARLYQRLLLTAPIPSAAHGGVPNRSLMSHVATHLPAAGSVLLMDLSNAYGSVSQDVVTRAWRYFLKPLCRAERMDTKERRALARWLGMLTTSEDALPVGAPTSAALLNLVAASFDEAMERLVLKELGVMGRYSRYLDDLVVSAAGGDLQRLIAPITKAIRTHDLGKPNTKKTRHMRRSAGEALDVMGISHDGVGFTFSASRRLAFEERLRVLYRSEDRMRVGSASNNEALGLLRFARMVHGRGHLPKRIQRAATFFEPSEQDISPSLGGGHS